MTWNTNSNHHGLYKNKVDFLRSKVKHVWLDSVDIEVLSALVNPIDVGMYNEVTAHICGRPLVLHRLYFKEIRKTGHHPICNGAKTTLT